MEPPKTRLQDPGLCRCAWEGCAGRGEYRAPKDRLLGDYVMFCLEHVRAYNAQWNFHAGLSPEEMEREIRASSTWDRPTWKLGELGANLGAHLAARVRTGRIKVSDPFGFAEGTAFDPARHERREDQARAAGPNAAPTATRVRALETLGLSAPFSLEGLRRRYKVLVKKHHPDANGGSAEAETRMKVINEAYRILRAEFTR